MSTYGQAKIMTQKGFSLVELLIAGVLGLILVGGVIQLFIGSNQNFNMQDELANIQEDGRMALLILEDDIQRAGWSFDFENVPAPVDILNSADGMNDTLVIAYNMPPNSPDCNGSAVASGQIVNRYFVQNEQLMCQGNGGGAAQPIIDGVQMFQVLYGVETDGACPDGVVNSYMNRTDVNNALLADRVVAVRVGLLLKSEDEVLPEPRSETFQVLNVSYTTPNDRLNYRLFQQTIYMPNATFATVGNPQMVIDCMAARVTSP